MIEFSRRRVLATVAGALVLPRFAAAGPPAEAAMALAAAAESQVGVTTHYDPAYVSLAFPNGDVPIDRGVCTDVIVRAYRQAFGYDLQAQVNADMKRAFQRYPKRWGLKAPDPNIDHRRVPNLQTFFNRQDAEKPKPTPPEEWQAGELVTQMVSEKLPHIGIVAAKRSADGRRPLVVHNIGRGTQVEDILDTYPITGRYAFFPVTPART